MENEVKFNPEQYDLLVDCLKTKAFQRWNDWYAEYLKNHTAADGTIDGVWLEGADFGDVSLDFFDGDVPCQSSLAVIDYLEFISEIIISREQEIPRFKLAHANLNNAYFHKINLNYFDFSNANLEGAIFDEGWMDKGIFENGKLAKSVFLKIFKTHKFKNHPGFYYSEQEFKNVDFTEAVFVDVSIYNSSFTNAILKSTWFIDVNCSDSIFNNVDASNVKLTRSKFNNCKLDNCQFTNGVIRDSEFKNSTMELCSFENVNQSPESSTLIFKEINIKDRKMNCCFHPVMASNFSGAVLKGVIFSNANFTNSSFRTAKLDNAQLTNSQFSRVNLRGTSMNNTILYGADLSGALIDIETLLRGNPKSMIDNKTNMTSISLSSMTIDPPIQTRIEKNIRRYYWEQWYKEHKILRIFAIPFWKMSNYGTSAIPSLTGLLLWYLFSFIVSLYMTWGIITGLTNSSQIISYILGLFGNTMLGMFGAGNILGADGFGMLFSGIQVVVTYFLLTILVTRFAVMFQDLTP